MLAVSSSITKIQTELATAFRRCDDPSCRRTRHIWRRICWRQSGVHLQQDWYCSPQCFEAALRERISRAGLAIVPRYPVRHRIPLGLLLLSRGQVNNRQLRLALEEQVTKGGRLGQWLEKLGFVTEHQVTVALGLQWACPVLPGAAPSDLGCAAMLPFRLLEKFRMLPVRFMPLTRVLYVAFSDGLDYTALYAIEQMLNCRTEACLISHSTMDFALERLGHERRSGDLLFESWRAASEMARITVGYVLKFGARKVRVVSCGEYIWVRLEAGADFANLLFLRDFPESEQNNRTPVEDDQAQRALG